MEHKIFVRYMQAAKLVCESEYLLGYQYGLRRFYHGENFGEEKQFDALKKRGGEIERGLLDGLAGREPDGLTVNAPQVGRPTVGTEVLPVLIVTPELKAALEKKAEELKISMPDARRKAYEDFSK